jgi:hypothetical protein
VKCPCTYFSDKLDIVMTLDTCELPYHSSSILSACCENCRVLEILFESSDCATMFINRFLEIVVWMVQVCRTLLRACAASLDFEDRPLYSLLLLVLSVIEDLDCSIVETREEIFLSTAV